MVRLTLVTRDHGVFVDRISIAKAGIHHVNVGLWRAENLETTGLVRKRLIYLRSFFGTYMRLRLLRQENIIHYVR